MPDAHFPTMDHSDDVSVRPLTLGERLRLLPIMAKLRELCRCTLLQALVVFMGIHSIRGSLWYLPREQA
jgi:hypothetical protein